MKAPTRIATSLDRAFAAGKMPCRHPQGHYLIESTTRPECDHRLDANNQGIICSCEAGRFGRECLHKAALRWCLAHGVLGVYALCANCRATRVRKVGGHCAGCSWQLAAIAEQEGRVA